MQSGATVQPAGADAGAATHGQVRDLGQGHWNDDEEISGLEETKGCVILGSGATIVCSSTIAAEEIQKQRLNQQELGLPTDSDSDRRFRFADGSIDEAAKVVEQPTTSGLLAGRTVKMHLIDKTGNDTCPL